MAGETSGSAIGWRRVLVAFALALSGTMLVSAALAASDASAAFWKCRASLARMQVQDAGNLEPVVANSSPANSCLDDRQGVRELTLGDEGGALVVDSANAETEIEPDTGAPGLQTATSETNGAGLRLVDSSGAIVVGVEGVHAQQSAQCVEGQPLFFDGRSRVVGLTINGREISPDDTLIQLADGLNGLPTAALIRIQFNEVLDETVGTTRTVTRRAVHIKVLERPGAAPLVDIVLGEAQAGLVGSDICTAPPPPPPIRWMCRASAARFTAFNGEIANIEPVVANKPGGATCRNDRIGFNTLMVGPLAILGPRVETTITPPQRRFPASLQTAEADANLGHATLTSSDGTVVIGVDAIQSHATAHCEAPGVPSFEGETHVAKLTLGGEEIEPFGTHEEMIGGTLVRIKFNDHVKKGRNIEKHTWTAVRIQLLQQASGFPILDVGLGEAMVGRKRDVCGPPPVA